MADSKVATQHPQAQAAIEELRKAAVAVRKIGNENIALQEQHEKDEATNCELVAEAVKLENQIEESRDAAAIVELVADCRRGIIDLDELYEKVLDGR